MLKIAFVIFREFLEMAILLGIITAVTRDLKSSGRFIILGIMLGITAASGFAFCIRALSIAIAGIGDEIFDVSVIILTVLMIAWTVTWMKGYSHKIKNNLQNLSDQIASGTTSYIMLALAVTIIVFREGTELILFLYSIASSNSIDMLNINIYLTGIALGGIAGLSAGIAIYLGLIKYLSKHIFNVSSIFLIVIAAGLASEAAVILTSSGIITSFTDQVWDTSWIIDDNNNFGKILNVVIGYDSKPNGMQIIFYISTIILILVMSKVQNYFQYRKNSK